MSAAGDKVANTRSHRKKRSHDPHLVTCPDRTSGHANPPRTVGMARPKGYDATRHLRARAEEKRGGNQRREEKLEVAGDGNLTASRDAYLADMLSLNYRQSTIDGCRKDLRHFIEWAHERGIDQPTDITRAMLESYRRHLSRLKKKNDKPLGVSTQRSRLGAVKNLFKWLC
ncbi:MAG: site-specific integrase, partial [Akkermansiaceae bacterium]